ncbi:NAD(P)/FAD-dependent oxidoreductase [Rhodocytophaga aerolata]|uniref:NADH:ubiquinone reductase (non-electrogenic) n=1 Tax=Rhodocytophaga aerolata TaxID=455078 RepID=A0ABT8RDF9_9BACT|nr:NAD(P)/FAD-dependent oxidoreductase [Rhodocytophaga aerolata]MDO1450138.1 NAD(P)/FAD-dependent oxidoreductase [Rhodocytophaga aerolata]
MSTLTYTPASIREKQAHFISREKASEKDWFPTASSMQHTTDSIQPADNRKRIVVVGGGFAGLNLIQQLATNPSYQITLVDKNNYNSFTPLLYQVATGFLEPSSISYPFRKLLRNKGITIRMAQLLRIDSHAQTLYLSDGELSYDYLVLAAGTKTNFFGNEAIEKNAIALKGMDDAIYMRNVLIQTLEKAAIEQNPIERKKLLTMVVAGGGPTGVEVAGMLAEMKNYIIEKDYPELVGAGGQIVIVDAQPTLLTPMSDKTHKETYEALVNLGVKVKLNTRVVSYENEQVQFSDGEIINAKTLIWAAGVIACTFEGIPQTSLGAGKRMVTDMYNRVIGFENIYAIGDISLQQTDPLYPTGHPQLAQVAIQQGTRLAKNFKAMARNKPLKPFTYFDRGEMAIVGRHHAVADLFKHKLHLSGFLGLLGWLFIHLISLVNYTNKIKTLYGWIIAYLTRDQALRMIFRPASRKEFISH